MHSADAYEGRQGIALRALSAEDGKVIAEYPLPALPVFDGMSAAEGCLYVSTTGGTVVCFGPALR